MYETKKDVQSNSSRWAQDTAGKNRQEIDQNKDDTVHKQRRQNTKKKNKDEI